MSAALLFVIERPVVVYASGHDFAVVHAWRDLSPELDRALCFVPETDEEQSLSVSPEDAEVLKEAGAELGKAFRVEVLV